MRYLLAFATLVAAACSGDDDPMTDPTCAEATEHDDLAWIQENVFTPSCAAFGPCHQGAALMAGELSLEDAATSHAQLVGVESVLFPQFDRVVAGDPENSYLMIILGHFDGPLAESGTMPYNSPLLCEEKRDAIARWIEAGANP